MPDRLVIEELPGDRVRVALRRSGQEFAEAAGEVAFVSPFGEAEREDLRWYLEDYLIAPYAVYEQRGQAIQGKLAVWGQALFEGVFGDGKPGRDAYLKAREGEATELAGDFSLDRVPEPALGAAVGPEAGDAAGARPDRRWTARCISRGQRFRRRAGTCCGF